jgi:D-amino-acid oxidase
MTIRVTVAGAGVVGLTCAVRLAEAGFTVDVLARELPLETSSAAGGGLWLPAAPQPAAPAGTAGSGPDTARWARATLHALRELAAGGAAHEVTGSGSGGLGGTGVAQRPGLLLGSGAAAGLRELSEDVGLAAVSTPAPGHDAGWRAVLPLVDLDRYLPYLVRRLSAAGGTLTRLAMATLPARGVVVNCTGVAARAMVPDPAVTPARVQVLRLADPGLGEWLLDATPGRECWVAPHGDHVVVGGPVEDDQWSPTPDPAVAAVLRERAARLVPALADAAELGHRVGLRPRRAGGVRLATERRGEATMIHCYGHGAAGLTLSWGTADDVLATVRAAAGVPEGAPAP